ncbi:hypothetical protein Ahy_B01g054913 [Arachis hypogaea]|uniref:Uncharacterized protein n=1 Tax=Arachis hypogaea TaxID=3818 RepID=A0A445AUG9_ARAHY|nr:hypothetical protein Ahy_B01g054913 [Arachis hypogaea]
MRSQEALFDLRSTVGEMVLQSPLRLLERSAASVLTREIFLLLRQILSRAYTLKVRPCTFTACSNIYTLSRSGIRPESGVLHIIRMDHSSKTLEIPCDHIILVLVHLDIIEMLASVVLERCHFKSEGFHKKGTVLLGSDGYLPELCVLASARVDDFVDVTAKVINEISHFKGKTLSPTGEGVDPRDAEFAVQLAITSYLVHKSKHRGKVNFLVVQAPKGGRRRWVMKRLMTMNWMKTHWSGQDANEKDEDDSCEKDHYLDVSLSKA